MKLYHITKEEYIESILTEGLKVNSKRNGFVKKSYIKEYKKIHNTQPIFLTNCPFYIISRQLGPNWVKQYKGVLLEIKLESSKVQLIDDLGHEYICIENIKPDNIKVHPKSKELFDLYLELWKLNK